MSASRDQTQKFAFVFENVTKLFPKEGALSSKPIAVTPVHKKIIENAKAHVSGVVIKAKDLKEDYRDVKTFAPTQFQVKSSRVQRPSYLGKRTHALQSEALDSLKNNLNSLEELHERLEFMLKELDSVLKNKK